MTGRDGFSVVVGYDSSDGARHALSRIKRWGVEGATLVVVAVRSSAVSPGLGDELSDQPLQPEPALQEARELLGSFTEGGTIETRAAIGDPAEVLIQVVRDVDADLLVVGRHGRDFLTRTLLGSVAQRVVQSAPCDVLVVR